MSERIETVKVVWKENKRLGYKIINKSDMQKSDKLFVEKKPAVIKKAE